LIYTLSEEEITKVHTMPSANEIWKTFTLAHRGSKEVKRNKLTLLRRQYEMFSMKNNKTI